MAIFIVSFMVFRHHNSKLQRDTLKNDGRISHSDHPSNLMCGEITAADVQPTGLAYYIFPYLSGEPEHFDVNFL
jgi:hypothetical protein